MVCPASNLEGHRRALELLTARGILPNSTETHQLGAEEVALHIVIADLIGIWPIQFARIFERLSSVVGVELEVDGERVDFHKKRGERP